MGEVQQVRHGNEGVTDGIEGRDAGVGVDRQHPGQQVDELPPIRLLHQYITVIEITWHVHLRGEREREE